MTTKTHEEQWRGELVNMLRKALGDGEVVTSEWFDFVSSLLSSQREALIRKAIACIPEESGVPSQKYEDGFRDCREQTLQKLGEI